MTTALKLNGRVAATRRVARFTEQLSNGRIRRRGSGGSSLASGPYVVSGLQTAALTISGGFRIVHHVSATEDASDTTVSVAALADGQYWLHIDLTYGDPSTWGSWTTTAKASLAEALTKRIHRRALFTVASGVVTALQQTNFGNIEVYDAGEDCVGV